MVPPTSSDVLDHLMSLDSGSHGIFGRDLVTGPDRSKGPYKKRDTVVFGKVTENKGRSHRTPTFTGLGRRLLQPIDWQSRSIKVPNIYSFNFGVQW